MIREELKMLVPQFSTVPTTMSPVTTTLTPTLFMATGVVQYNPAPMPRWNITQQGLLSLMAWGPGYSDGGYRIVVDPANVDPYALVASLGALIDYGNEHEALTIAQRLSTMKGKHIALRCGPAVETVRSVLTSYGVTSRQVHLLTAEAGDDLDDGHVATELTINGEKRFFDIAGDSYFRDSGNHHASLADVIEAGVSNCAMVRLAPTGSSSFGIFRALFDQRLSDDARYLEWCRRVFQIPGILDVDGNVYFYMPPGTSHRQTWLLGLQSNYRVLSKADWLARFY